MQEICDPFLPPPPPKITAVGMGEGNLDWGQGEVNLLPYCISNVNCLSQAFDQLLCCQGLWVEGHQTEEAGDDTVGGTHSSDGEPMPSHTKDTVLWIAV